MSVRESEIYQKRYRLISSEEGIRAYNEAMCICVNENITFDSKKAEFTSLDYFITAVVSDILIAIKKYASKDGEVIMDLESQTEAVIKNPLSLLNVRGFDEAAYIESLHIKIYLYTFMEADEAEGYFRNILSKCLIYNTLAGKIGIDVQFEFAI